MPRPHALYLMLLLLVCLGVSPLLAQEAEMKAPPIPEIIPTPPPDPDTLPPPPQLEWAPLGPKGPEDELGSSTAVYVPPPQPEASIAPPPPPVIETLVATAPDPIEEEKGKADVEVWRDASEFPQIPASRPNQLERAYVAGTEPVTLRVRFNPAAAGKSVIVMPGRGIRLVPPDDFLTVSPSGECIVSVQLHEEVPQSYIVFYCAGVSTTLPVWRASLHTVEMAEAATGGGE